MRSQFRLQAHFLTEKTIMASFHLCFSYMVMMLMIISCNLYGAHSGGCKARDISISQGKISETGIPEYSVQIANVCAFGCAGSDIHVHCGQFASTEVVNPAEFRISLDECLVKNGQPLKPHQLISFTYSNSFMYPLAFKSAKFIC